MHCLLTTEAFEDLCKLIESDFCLVCAYCMILVASVNDRAGVDSFQGT